MSNPIEDAAHWVERNSTKLDPDFVWRLKWRSAPKEVKDAYRRGYEEGLEEAAQTVQLISGEELLGYVKTIRREKAGEAITFPRSVCAWEQDEEGNWETGCGGMWTLLEGKPTDHKMKFCPRCGGKLEFTEYKEEPC